jgi:hypothetical protein
MVVKFLELDSNYRNRNLYPNPADFQVNISQTGIRGNTNALDPVTLGYPIITFSPNDIPCKYPTPADNGLSLSFNGYTGSISPTGSIINSSSETSFVLTFDYSTKIPLSTKNGYYVGLMLVLQDDTINPARRILSWTFLKNDTINSVQYFLITIDKAFDYDKTIASPTTGQTCSFKIYNPTDLSVTANSFMFLPNTQSIPNYYNNYIIFNQDKNNYAKINSFDMNSHLASFNGITGGGWGLTDKYTLRQQPPRVANQLIQSVTGNSIVSLGFTGDSSYIGNFIAVYQNPPGYTGPVTDPEISQILSTNDQYFTTTPFAYTPSVASPAEVLGFNYDNVSPFVYTGTNVSQNQPSAQEITLNSLTLPNVTLANGGRIAYYPYVYVEIENVSSTGSGNRNLIYSNNPNTYKAVFKVPITDLNHPQNSPFVKLTGNGMKQTITFKQNDDMRISVKLPNGDLFQTSSSDTDNGQSPNPLLQISAIFGMEKL